MEAAGQPGAPLTRKKCMGRLHGMAALRLAPLSELTLEQKWASLSGQDAAARIESDTNRQG